MGTLTNDTAVTSLNSLTFNASAGAITLDGKPDRTGRRRLDEQLDTQGNNIALNAGVNGSGGLTGGEATTLSLTKSGSGTLTIGGNGNFAGTANVGVGTLALGNGANLDTSTVNVSAGATLAARPGANGATNNIANNISLLAGASLSMADGATSTLAIAGNATLGGGTGSFLTFDIGGTTTTTDRLAINGTASIGAGGTISINTVGSTPLTIATYPLITAAAGLPTGPTGLLLTTKVYVGTTPYTLSVLSDRSLRPTPSRR